VRRGAAAAAAIACAALVALCAGAALAAPLTVQVVNQRGVEQASFVSHGGQTRPTNGHGRLGLDVASGDAVTVTRGGAAPEGAGVAYSVPSPVPAGPVRVTLPALPDAVVPEHDATEAWLLAAVNAERAALGRTPLRQSGSLNRAVDAYARHLLATGEFSHTALADPWVRAVDQGWPFPGGSGVGEVLALAPTKEIALDLWRNSSGHWTLLMAPDANVTGVARAGNIWAMAPSTCGPSDAPERCEIGQSGVRPASTAPPPSGVPGDVGAAAKQARLRVRLRRRGHRVVVGVRLVKGRGVMHVSIRKGRRRARVRAHRHGTLLRATAVLRRVGRWNVVVSFAGRDGWADRRLAPRRVRVLRPF
jgi:uncharacterized protein YkwD